MAMTKFSDFSIKALTRQIDKVEICMETNAYPVSLSTLLSKIFQTIQNNGMANKQKTTKKQVFK